MPDDEELREELASAFCPRAALDGRGPCEACRMAVNARVLPVVERYAARRAAEALRAAAEIAHCGVDQRRLDYRADALDGAQDRHGRTETGT